MFEKGRYEQKGGGDEKKKQSPVPFPLEQLKIEKGWAMNRVPVKYMCRYGRDAVSCCDLMKFMYGFTLKCQQRV